MDIVLHFGIVTVKYFLYFLKLMTLTDATTLLKSWYLLERNGWHFGMECHIAVDVRTGYVYTIEVTPANDHNITAVSRLIRVDYEAVYGDFGYIGVEKCDETTAVSRICQQILAGIFPQIFTECYRQDGSSHQYTFLPSCESAHPSQFPLHSLLAK